MAQARSGNRQLERVRSEGDADVDLGGRVVLQGYQEVLDDAVPGELDAGREEPGVARHLQTGLGPRGLAEEPVELGQHRLGLGRRLVFQVGHDASHVVERLTAGSLDGDEGVLGLVGLLSQGSPAG